MRGVRADCVRQWLDRAVLAAVRADHRDLHRHLGVQLVDPQPGALFGFADARRYFGKPRWNGLAPKGKTIVLYAEQGFGDAIQFVRYVPLVAGRGGRVIVECQRELKRLFSRMKSKARRGW